MTTTTLTWNDTADDWLTEAQQLNNAQLVAYHFKGTDWTPEAISALCGNMAHESSLNPNIYEFGYNHSLDRGYGLVQWTPATKYIDWANANGLPYDKGDSQLARIDYEVNNNIQWIPIADFNDMTFAQFRANSGGWSSDYLTAAFTWSYERPARTAGEDSLPARQAFAAKCLSTLDWTGSAPTPSNSHVQSVALSSNQYEKAGTLNNMTYVEVKSGDTLSSIAKKYGVDMGTIFNVTVAPIPNKNNLKAGQVLLVPKAATKPAAPQPTYYTIKSGDNLSKIAATYKTTVTSLKSINGLKSDLIKVGQKVRVK